MAGQRGRDVVVKIGDGGEPEVFAIVAGIRARTIVLGVRLVDATTAQSPDAWRELIAGAGTKRIEVAEAYRVRVSEGVDVLREWDVDSASATYSATDQAADFPAGGDAVIEVAQLGANSEPGGWASLNVAIPAP